MVITAALVKELRERTGSGMMECKKALVASEGDIEGAIDAMRKAGQAKAGKKAGRIAAEGVISIKTSNDGKQASMVEINCETDFVAKDENFKQFVDQIMDIALAQKITDVAKFADQSIASLNQTVEQKRAELVAKLGENIHIRRATYLQVDAPIATYSHGGRIGVIVGLASDNDTLGKDLAMHVAASKPECVSADQVPQALLDKEKEIFMAQAQDSGKPQDIIEKMVGGRLKKFINEVCLEGQPFVKQPDITVAKLLQEESNKVIDFCRYEVGEGIEKKTENFADEVMAQVKGS